MPAGALCHSAGATISRNGLTRASRRQKSTASRCCCDSLGGRERAAVSQSIDGAFYAAARAQSIQPHELHASSCDCPAHLQRSSDGGFALVSPCWRHLLDSFCATHTATCRMMRVNGHRQWRQVRQLDSVCCDPPSSAACVVASSAIANDAPAVCAGLQHRHNPTP